MIGSVGRVQALPSAALVPSTITEDISGTVMMCHRRTAQHCRSAARLRSAGMVPPQSGQMAKLAAMSDRSPLGGLSAGSQAPALGPQ